MKFGLALLFVCIGASAQQLSTVERAKVDGVMEKVYRDTGVPSVVAGIYRGDQVIYARALGSARLPADGKAAAQQALPADATMAYPIGSISKQFTATCVLLLQERGVLKLDDPVSRWFPEFTRAQDVTLRNLLTHTSGYSDYAPQDYTIPAWTKPIDSYKLIREWATKPLDFEPGTRTEYSNTNFQMAALIVAKASGMGFHDFLWANVITPLKLQGVLDLDADQAKVQPLGYERHAAGPMRHAILEAAGWYTGDGNLAMPVATLLMWDASILHRTLLKPASYDVMETEYKLKDGSGAGFGLGVEVMLLAPGLHMVYHSGEVGGFVSENDMVLEQNIAFAALTNIEGPGAGTVTRAFGRALVQQPAAAATSAKAAPPTVVRKPRFDAKPAAQATTILAGMSSGTINRTLFTADANAYFNAETLGDFHDSLQTLGAAKIQQTSEESRGGMLYRLYRVEYASKKFDLSTYTTPQGKLEQFLLYPR